MSLLLLGLLAIGERENDVTDVLRGKDVQSSAVESTRGSLEIEPIEMVPVRDRKSVV